jgi:hypothetical protein
MIKKSSRQIQILSGTLGIGNLIIIICIMLWFPAVGFDPFNFEHVRYVVAAEMISIIILADLSVSFVRNSGYLPFWVAAVLQIAQWLLAKGAVPSWPGGDDGCKIGWQLFVMPVMVVITLYSLLCCVMSFAIWNRKSANRGR